MIKGKYLGEAAYNLETCKLDLTKFKLIKNENKKPGTFTSSDLVSDKKKVGFTMTGELLQIPERNPYGQIVMHLAIESSKCIENLLSFEKHFLNGKDDDFYFTTKLVKEDPIEGYVISIKLRTKDNGWVFQCNDNNFSPDDLNSLMIGSKIFVYFIPQYFEIIENDTKVRCGFYPDLKRLVLIK